MSRATGHAAQRQPVFTDNMPSLRLVPSSRKLGSHHAWPSARRAKALGFLFIPVTPRPAVMAPGFG
jgi:hypothetical protein